MNFARVVGKVVVTRRAPNFTEPLLLLVQPLDENLEERGTPLVAAAPVGPPGEGDLVFYVSGSDATAALRDSFQPVDAAIVGLVDGYRDMRASQPPPTEEAAPGTGLAAGPGGGRAAAGET